MFLFIFRMSAFSAVLNFLYITFGLLCNVKSYWLSLKVFISFFYFVAAGKLKHHRSERLNFVNFFPSRLRHCTLGLSVFVCDNFAKINYCLYLIWCIGDNTWQHRRYGRQRRIYGVGCAGISPGGKDVDNETKRKFPNTVTIPYAHTSFPLSINSYMAGFGHKLH